MCLFLSGIDSELNLELTKELQKQEKYTKFLDWAKTNGVISKNVIAYDSAKDVTTYLDRISSGIRIKWNYWWRSFR